MIDQLRAAAEALNQGDPEPFASLIADENEWRGVSHGHLWWKSTPSCHGSDEAREVLKFQIKKRGDRRIEIQPEFTQVGDNKIIGSTQWLGADGRRHERFQVITLRDGKIVDMQGCASRREAERFAHRH
ncbi:MAG: nuclear transport factor 2 family protein [Burkholderiales bacterium]